MRIIEKRESIARTRTEYFSSYFFFFFGFLARFILAALSFHGANALSNNTKFNIPGKCRYKYNRVPILSVAIVHSRSPPPPPPPFSLSFLIEYFIEFSVRARSRLY